jgi:hypothetical protein
MITTIIKKIIFLRNMLIYKKFNFLSRINNSKFRTDPSADFVVSIATYPKRAHLLPAVFEALNQQTLLPLKWIVVLTAEEWPGLQLPKYLNKLINRGIEIVWVKNNSFAVKKLLPVMQKYPDLGVITLDDDIIYHKSLVRGLLNNRTENPETIVGYVGKAMVKKENQLHMFFREKNAADKNTPSSQVYLIGWGGIYYPAGSLHEKAFNEDEVRRIVPGRGSDIWFWAATLANNTNQICLGLPINYNLGVPIPQNDKTKPKDRPKTDVLLERFQMAIDYFGIREILLNSLPNQE